MERFPLDSFAETTTQFRTSGPARWLPKSGRSFISTLWQLSGVYIQPVNGWTRWKPDTYWHSAVGVSHVSMGQRGTMNTPSFFLASLCPALLLGLRAIALRRISRAMCLVIDLAILVASIPIGVQLVGWVENFPEYPGDHSPGLGIAFYLLFLVWLCCFALWSARVVVCVVRKYLMAGNR